MVAEALEALGGRRPRMLEYGVSDAEAFAVGLACGGRIRVMVEPVGVGRGACGWTLLERLVGGAGGADGRRSMRCARSGWERRLVAGPGDPLWPEARGGADRRTGRASRASWFLGVHNPPLRMAVVGAVHIAQALVPMARLAGYDVARRSIRARPSRARRGFPGRRCRTTGRTRRSTPSGSTPARRW